MTTYRILAINPGSTSTKISVFDNEKEIMTQTLSHTSEQLQPYKQVADQFEFRKELIVHALEQASIPVGSIAVVIGRGGLIKPVHSGVYEVNEALKQDLVYAELEHASNLGGLIAADMAASLPGVKAYIADPVVVDELQDVARVVGHPLFTRDSIFHALNQKAISRTYAQKVGRRYEELNLVVAHMGGGISVGAHCLGKVIDVNNALDGEGPFSPERSGTLPAGQLAKLCFSGEYTYAEVKKMIAGTGGLVALLGSNHVRDLINQGNAGDERARVAVEAMIYNVGKSIGAMAAVLHGRVDAIILTGGIANSIYVCDYLKEMCSFIAPVEVFPGEDEMEALAQNALRILRGEQTPSVYK